MGLQGVRHDLATEKQQIYKIRNEKKLTTEIKDIFENHKSNRHPSMQKYLEK